MLKEILVLSFLGFNSWIDIRKKEISLGFVVLFAVLVFGWKICTEGISLEFFIPMGVSAFLVALSVLTRGAIGMGDGLLMFALGTALGIEEFLVVFLLGLLGSALWAVLLLFVFRKEKNTEIPFVPFLLLGYVGGVLL